MELNYKIIGGVLLLVITTIATTVYVKEATGYKTCSTGWVLQENGQFICESRDISPQWCYKFSEPNAEGISTRCYLGIPVEGITIVEPKSILKRDYTTSPDGKICYIKGNLRNAVSCQDEKINNLRKDFNVNNKFNVTASTGKVSVMNLTVGNSGIWYNGSGICIGSC